MRRPLSWLTLRTRLYLVLLVPLLGMTAFAALWAGQARHVARDAETARHHTTAVVTSARVLYETDLLGTMIALVVNHGGVNDLGMFRPVVEANTAATMERLYALSRELEAIPVTSAEDRASLVAITRAINELPRIGHTANDARARPSGELPWNEASAEIFEQTCMIIEHEVERLVDRGAGPLAGAGALLGISELQRLVLEEAATTMVAAYGRRADASVHDAAIATASAAQILALQLAPRARARLVGWHDSADGRRWQELTRDIEQGRHVNPLVGLRLVQGRIAVIEGIQDEISRGLTTSATTTAKHARRSFELALMFAIALLLSSIGLAYIVLRSTTRTLKRVEDRARRIGEGDLDIAPLAVRARDETGLLAMSFDQMTGTLRTIQAQVDALADGRGDDPILSHHVPGRIGESMARSVVRLSRMTSALRSSEEMARLTVETAVEAIWTLDEDDRILAANAASELVTGRRPDQLIGQLSEVLSLEGVPRSDAGEVLTVTDHEARFVRDDGTSVDVLVSTRKVTGVDGSRRTMVFARDISNQKRLEQRLEWEATHDALTGLPNRTALTRELLRSATTGPDGLTVLFIDLDRFKFVNDALGHRMGDELLRQVASRLQQHLREGDLLARLGGDEFVVVHHATDDLWQVEQMARRLVQVLEQPFDLAGTPAHISASIGIVAGDGNVETAELIRRADIAMYRAKQSGRGRIERYDQSMHGWARERVEREEALREALASDQLEPHFQPIVSLVDGRIDSVEMLARWSRPGLGPVSPAEFIPIAEETGLVVDVGRWALSQAARTAVTLRDTDLNFDVPIAVNISGVHLMHGDLVADVEQALHETGAAPEWLRIEITESYLLEESLDTVNHALREIAAMGVGLSIDDFGTGYSSLTYLRRLPADEVKIDQSYIAALGEDSSEAAIVKLVSQLAHTLGLRVVAEGVETEHQSSLVRAAGCDLAQGYLFARPAPLAEFTRWLTAHEADPTRLVAS